MFDHKTVTHDTIQVSDGNTPVFDHKTVKQDTRNVADENSNLFDHMSDYASNHMFDDNTH